MPSGTWGNYSQEETITKFRGMMELLMEKRCRPVMKMEATVPPGAVERRRPGVRRPERRGALAWRRAATPVALGGGCPLPLLLT